MSDLFSTEELEDRRHRRADFLSGGFFREGRSYPGNLLRIVFLPLLLTLLASCGNPPSNSNNINFPYGMAVCSFTCNAYSQTGTPASIGTPFAAVTSYGSRQVLIFTGYTNSSSNAWLISNNSLSPNTSLYNSLQGPDGLLISSQGFTTSNGYSCPAPVLYGSDGIGNLVGIWCAFNPNDGSNPGPTIKISSGAFQSPEGLALDWVNSSGTVLSAPILFVANPGSSNILAFDLSQITGGGTANLSPSGGLVAGTNGGLPFGQPANLTGLNGPAFVAFSNSRNTLFVSNTGNSQVNLYGNGYCIGVNQEPLNSNRPTDCSNNQNVTPSVWFSGSNTYLSSPSGIAYYQGGLYVVDPSAGSVLIWDNVMNTVTPGGNIGPTRRINGSNTNQSYPYALAIDGNTSVPPGNTFYVSQLGNGKILGYNNATTISGNIAPTYTIGVTNPSLSSGNGSGGGSTGYPGFP